MPLAKDREPLYAKLRDQIKPTPLRKIRMEGNNTVYAKEEYRNPTGSHYDRVMLTLLERVEADLEITHGYSVLCDTTSGNGGVALARLAHLLGYDCIIIMPKHMSKITQAHIEMYGARLHLTEGASVGEMVDVLPETIREIKASLDDREKLVFLNHGRQPGSLEGTRWLGEEIREQLRTHNGLLPSFFVGALGNGLSILGPAKVLREEWPGVTIVGVEPYEAPVVYQLKYGDKTFKEQFGRELEVGPHWMVGTGVYGVLPARHESIFPFLHEAKDLLDSDPRRGVVLVEKEDAVQMAEELDREEAQFVGWSSAAVMCAIRTLIKRENLSGKTFVTIFYDQRWKYLIMG